jgi:hypothetical protein
VHSPILRFIPLLTLGYILAGCQTSAPPEPEPSAGERFANFFSEFTYQETGLRPISATLQDPAFELSLAKQSNEFVRADSPVEIACKRLRADDSAQLRFCLQFFSNVLPGSSFAPGPAYEIQVVGDTQTPPKNVGDVAMYTFQFVKNPKERYSGRGVMGIAIFQWDNEKGRVGKQVSNILRVPASFD